MSEFIDSYHLRTVDVNDAINLLKDANLEGFIFPESNGWVTLVLEDDQFKANENLIQFNTGTLIYYVSAEDYGWFFSIYEGSKEVCHYECTWEEELEINDAQLDKDVLINLVAGNPRIFKKSSISDDINKMLYPEDNEDLFGNSPGNQFSELVGLDNTEWFSYDYFLGDFESGEDIYPGIIYVRGNGFKRMSGWQVLS